MLTFFRKIRKGLLGSGQARKYILYAIGEIALVVIGILIALQINNWNEERKLREKESAIYKNLLTSLRLDSVELIKIIEFQKLSVQCQKVFMSSELQELKDSMTIDSIFQMIINVHDGLFSFFPKYGSYNMIVSNNEMNILRSTEIKSSLTNLYDYKCKRYENIDAAVDEMFNQEVVPFLVRYMGYQPTIGFVTRDIDKLNLNYEELVIQCSTIYGLLRNSYVLLLEIQELVNYLIQMINNEI